MKNTTTKLHRWIIAVLLLTLSTNTYAQNNEDVLGPCQSYWHQYNNIKEQSSIVRSDQDYRVVHTEHIDNLSGAGIHTFAILRYSSNIETYSKTSFGAIDSTYYYVNISDMEIFEDICYFCGTMTHTYIDPAYNVLAQDGIVGYFSPSSLHNGSGDVFYYRVPNTSQLTKLAISGPGQAIAQVNAIGIMNDYKTACMVEIRETNLLEWKATLDYIPSSPKLYFSDILATHDSIILLSQLKCNNDHPHDYGDYDLNHQRFLLDKFSADGCYHDCYPSSVTHYMAHYHLSDNEPFNFHYNKAPMALSNLNHDYFTLAFGVKKTNSENGGIRFFFFENIWQYIGSLFYYTGKKPQVFEMINRNYTLETYILSKDNSHTKGVITSPLLTGATNTVRFINTPGPSFNSLAQKANTAYLEITGHNTAFDLNLFEQNLDSLHTTSCLSVNTVEPIVFPSKEGALFFVSWEFLYHNKEVEWKKAEIIDKGAAESEIICKYCN